MALQKTILVVDDEPDLREILVAEFDSEGYNVLEAPDGEAAFALIHGRKDIRVDLVLTDVQMPHWDGVRLLQEIKKVHPDIPVVMFLTGYAKITAEEAYDQGAEALFEKPFDRLALLAAVRRVLHPELEPVSLSRESVRLEAHSQVAMTYQNGTFRNQNGLVTNVAKGGAFVATETAPPKLGTEIRFSMNVQDVQPYSIEGDGIVRWIRSKSVDGLPVGYGVEFISFKTGSRARFYNLVNALKTRSYIPRQ